MTSVTVSPLAAQPSARRPLVPCDSLRNRRRRASVTRASTGSGVKRAGSSAPPTVVRTVAADAGGERGPTAGASTIGARTCRGSRGLDQRPQDGVAVARGAGAGRVGGVDQDHVPSSRRLAIADRLIQRRQRRLQPLAHLPEAASAMPSASRGRALRVVVGHDHAVEAESGTSVNGLPMNIPAESPPGPASIAWRLPDRAPEQSGCGDQLVAAHQRRDHARR